MMFSKEDLKLPEGIELLQFLPIFIFVALVAPFLILAYTIGFVMDITGWLKTST